MVCLLKIACFTLLATTSFAKTDMVIPWLTNQSQFRSKLILNNLNSETAAITLMAARPQMTASESFGLELAPFEQKVLEVADFFSSLGEGSGFSLRILSDSNDIKGGFVINGTGTASGTSPSQAGILNRDHASPLLLYDYLTVRKDQGFAALVVVNAGEETAQIRISAYQAGHQQATKTFELQPNQPLAQTTASLFPGLSGELFAIAESNQPLLGTVFLFNQFLEPSMANAVALKEKPAIPEFVPTVSTAFISDLTADGFIGDDQENLYLTEGWQRDKVFRLNPDGSSLTLASGLSGPVHLVRDGKANLYVSEFRGDQVSRIAPDGTVDVYVEGLDAPTALAFDKQGQLWIANYGKGFNGQTITKRLADGSTEIGLNDPLIKAPIDIIFAENGDLYIANQGDARVLKATPQGEVSLIAQLPISVLGHMVECNDLFYVSSINNHRLYTVTKQGEVRELAGTGVVGDLDGPAPEAQFSQPNGLWVNPSKDILYVGHGNQGQFANRFRKIKLR